MDGRSDPEETEELPTRWRFGTVQVETEQMKLEVAGTARRAGQTLREVARTLEDLAEQPGPARVARRRRELGRQAASRARREDDVARGMVAKFEEETGGPPPS